MGQPQIKPAGSSHSPERAGKPNTQEYSRHHHQDAELEVRYMTGNSTSKIPTPLQPDSMGPCQPSKDHPRNKIREISADWRAMRTVILIAAGLLALATACSSTFNGTPTPRPTYTPYPTYTPAPLPQLGTDNSPTTVTFSQADSDGVPLLALGTNSALPTTTISPKTFIEAGKQESFQGETEAAVERGEDAFAQGRYQEALEEFLEAQRLHSSPSPVLQNWIGNSYSAMGQHNQAIQHYTNAIELEDDAANRTNRGELYRERGQCSAAIEDAKTALALEPVSTDGYHTDIEANIILAGCYAQEGNYLIALQHTNAAYSLATEHNIRAERVEEIRHQRESIQLILEGKAWPEDLLSGPVLAILKTGLELYERGEYQEAIAQFKEAQTQHSQPSGNIQTWIGGVYSAMGQHETAIKHYTDAIDIRDNAYHRIRRAWEYANNGRCTEATADAETALAMPPYTEPQYHTGTEAHWILANCYMTQGNRETALRYGKAGINLARQHGYTEEEIRLLEETLGIAEAAEGSEKHPADLAEKYRLAGEKLDADRPPSVKWTDQSNWHDGISHLLPKLPLEPAAPIRTSMTCAQSEALQMAVFPDGEDAMTWHLEPNAEDIAKQWGLNLATTIWGEHPQAMEWYERETFQETCGAMMQ